MSINTLFTRITNPSLRVEVRCTTENPRRSPREKIKTSTRGRLETPLPDQSIYRLSGNIDNHFSARRQGRGPLPRGELKEVLGWILLAYACQVCAVDK